MPPPSGGVFVFATVRAHPSRLNRQGRLARSGGTYSKMTNKLQTLKSSVPMLDTRRVPTMQAGSWRTSDQTAAQRGYGYKWQKAREGFLRSHPLCVMCQADDRVTAATVVDHKIPHRGDQALFWDRGNWQSLCATHHSRDKQREEQRR